jgi:hypothetical protein
VKRALVAASALVCAGLATSFAASQLLPSAAEDRSGCYWADWGWVPFVVCNLEAVTAPALLELFYNAWLWGLIYSLLFAPLAPFGLLLSLVSWGAVIVVVRTLWRRARRSR